MAAQPRNSGDEKATTRAAADVVEQVKEAEKAPTKASSMDDLYQALAAPFESTFKDQRGGLELEYITGEQCVSRLNGVLGPFGWSFVVREHGSNAESDEVWVLGELTLTLDGRTATRQQFGSQKIRRNRATGTPVDIGFDSKAAATDALKKCASLVGVGLYLSRKEVPASAEPRVPTIAAVPSDDDERLVCEEC